ncbi:unnamed protein product [Oppiella nova]|uniref:Uncharacterized protein n=1 Tax=Oppiella nova TaxID=334625 RepID=A0A7R9QN51_9ACAR|nr:unnamed protein product [Oppiella nova]CAG2168895.1 unnamed protein product [Oppiella nova]
MSKLVIVISMVLAIGLVSAHNLTPEDMKQAKLVFCGKCKDEKVQKELVNFAQCARNDYKDEVDKIISIKQANSSDQDKCMKLIKDEFDAFNKANPDGMTKIMKCFHDNVKKEDLAKCTCKDDGVKADISKFLDCVMGHYPKELSNIMAIRETTIDNRDECVAQIQAEIETYTRADPTRVIQVMDCFRANVVTQHLTKCQ